MSKECAHGWKKRYAAMVMVNGEIPDIWRREQRAVVGGQLEVSSLYKTAAT